MEGISTLDLMVIQNPNGEIKCQAGGPSKDPKTEGKFVAWIELYKNGEFDRHIVNTNARFDSEEQAVAWAEGFVKAVRDMPEIKFTDFIPSEDLAAVQAIVKAAFG